MDEVPDRAKGYLYMGGIGEAQPQPLLVLVRPS
jgi:hypothetical protein